MPKVDRKGPVDGGPIQVRERTAKRNSSNVLDSRRLRKNRARNMVKEEMGEDAGLFTGSNMTEEDTLP